MEYKIPDELKSAFQVYCEAYWKARDREQKELEEKYGRFHKRSKTEADWNAWWIKSG